jgi:hypothetical protein
MQAHPGSLPAHSAALFCRVFSFTITGFMFNDLGGISIDEALLQQVIDRYLLRVLPEDDPSRIEKTKKMAPLYRATWRKHDPAPAITDP